MKLLNFTANLAKLWAGVNYNQLRTREEDHNKLYTGKKIPIGVTFAITFVCNFECAHCSADIDNTKADKDASTDLVLKVLTELKDLGGQRLSFTGGEPLTRKGINEILNKATKDNFYVSLTTNGWHVDRYLEQLKNIDLLILSLDGTEEVHDFIRRKKGSYKKVIESIKTAKANNIPVLVNTTVMNSNAEDIPKLSKILKELNVNWTIDLYLDNTNLKKWQTGSNISRPTEELLNNVLIEAKKNPNLCNSPHYINSVEKQKKESQICFAGIGYCVISPEGTMYPCFPAQFDNDYLGMDLKKMSFNDAFQNMPLYRKKCNGCDYVCHLEMNSLYSFHPSAIYNGLKYLYKNKLYQFIKSLFK
jgi:MoaA/NifB/PqqE/SkfB family radical SAM enzyme